MWPMPIYEYACTACGERTEARQGFGDPPLEECPQCGGRLRKLYSPVGIVFKGSGFYATDAKKDSASKAKASSDSDKGSKPSEGPSSEGGSSKSRQSEPKGGSPTEKSA